MRIVCDGSSLGIVGRPRHRPEGGEYAWSGRLMLSHPKQTRALALITTLRNSVSLVFRCPAHKMKEIEQTLHCLSPQMPQDSIRRPCREDAAEHSGRGPSRIVLSMHYLTHLITSPVESRKSLFVSFIMMSSAPCR